jgi:hypothetical protein
MMTDVLGFRIVGPCTSERRLVDWQAAFVAHASLDDRIDTNQEAYLSAFVFGDDFEKHLVNTGSTKGFDGSCGSEFIWFDIDRENDLETARRDAARLAMTISERHQLDDAGVLMFFSGSKGFHLGLPTDLWEPPASTNFNLVCKRLAEGLAASARAVAASAATSARNSAPARVTKCPGPMA